MTTINISLPEDLKAFIDAQVAARGYGSASEYVRELIRRERDLQRLQALLLEGPASGPGVPIDREWFDAWRARIRASGAA
jgi:antitoxin ParD1/3/4